MKTTNEVANRIVHLVLSSVYQTHRIGCPEDVRQDWVRVVEIELAALQPRAPSDDVIRAALKRLRAAVRWGNVRMTPDMTRALAQADEALAP